MKKLKLLGCVFIVFFLGNCNSFRSNLLNVGGYEEAIYNSIMDFSNTRLFNDGSVYFISYELNKPSYYSIFIMEDSENKLSYSKNKSLVDNHLPNRYVVYNNKLFLWWDDNYKENIEILEILELYEMIQDVDENPFIDHFTDDKKNIAYYFFCKENILTYRRVITNRIKNKDIGVNCNF